MPIKIARERSRTSPKIGLTVMVNRRGVGFEVCVMGTGRGYRTRNPGALIYECGHGSNPRRALAQAFRKAAAGLAKRKGAFEGRR